MKLINVITGFFMLPVVSSNEELPLSTNPPANEGNKKIFKACTSINNKDDRRVIYHGEDKEVVCQAVSHTYLITLPKHCQSKMIQYLSETAKKNSDKIFIPRNSLVDKINDQLIGLTLIVMLFSFCAILYIGRNHITYISKLTINNTNLIRQIVNLNGTRKDELLSEMVTHMLPDMVKSLLSSSDNVKKLIEIIDAMPEVISELAKQINHCPQIKSGLARNSELVDNLDQENFRLTE